MLKVLREGESFRESCALLLGGFDGLHAGHMELLAAAKRTGLPAGMTLLTGNKEGGNLFTFAEREIICERAGCAFVIEYPFTEELKNTPAKEFLKELFSRVNAKAVFCGEDFRFGKGAEGTPELLKTVAPCPVEIAPIKTADGKKVAASLIKEKIAGGDPEGANRLLFGNYFIRGEVERGRQVGRTYGFPTLNLSYPAGKFPVKEGVYAGYAETPAGKFPAIVNFGARPTFGVPEKKIEAYLKGFDGDLYGETVCVYPAKFLRPIRKFASEEELKNQLKEDVKRI